jgi:hypothetical protein
MPVAGHLVHKVAVDIQQAGAVIGLMDDVVVPDLVIQGARSGHGSSLSDMAVKGARWRR